MGLFYGSKGIDKTLTGVDDWHTYVENQGNGQWSVSFVANGQELFYALVDVEKQQILESSAK